MYKPFYLHFADVSCFKRGDILSPGWGKNCRVLKVYRDVWWRRLLRNWSFKVHINELKIKHI